MIEKIKCTPEDCRGYLQDESGLTGRGDSISFPENARDAEEIIRFLSKKKIPMTFQGVRTGISGAAVPSGGHIMNMSRMNKIMGLRMNEAGEVFVIAEPGLTLQELNLKLEALSFDTKGWNEESISVLNTLKKSKKHYFFPPNPTEDSASLGGIYSGNGSGPNKICYGDSSKYVEEAELCFKDGKIRKIKRGDYVFPDKSGAMPIADGDSRCRGLLPVKGMDFLDFISGSEGMIGAVLGLTLRLVPESEHHWGLVFFMPDWMGAVKLADSFLKLSFSGVRLTAFEFLDDESLRTVEKMKESVSSLRIIPAFPENTGGALYLEMEGEAEAALEEAMMELLNAFELCGGKESDTWASSENRDIKMFRLMRHSVPEAVNTLRWPHGTRTTADIVFKAGSGMEKLQRCKAELRSLGLRAVIFGHYAMGQLHGEILPTNEEEYNMAVRLIEKWGREDILNGIGYSGEGSVGKLWKSLHSLKVSELLEKERAVKTYFDSEGLLNPDNYFP